MDYSPCCARRARRCGTRRSKARRWNVRGADPSSSRCSGGLPPLHEAYENGIGDLKLGRRAVTTNLAAAAFEDGDDAVF